MADFAFRLKAQQWRTDSYYVSSSQPIKDVTVVATTESEARGVATQALGAPRPGRYWRFWLVDAVDARLAPTSVNDIPGGER